MEDLKDMQVEDVKEEVKEEVVEEVQEQKEEAKAPFDYDKLAQIVASRQARAEEGALNGFFKDQGLTPEEAKAAISDFKTKQAQMVPDVNAIQAQATEAMKRAVEAEMHSKAMMLARELGVDIKAMPYVIRMADTDEVTASGTVDEGKLKAKLTEVVEAIPSLKLSMQAGGFQTVGADTTGDKPKQSEEQIYNAFGVKKK